MGSYSSLNQSLLSDTENGDVQHRESNLNNEAGKISNEGSNFKLFDSACKSVVLTEIKTTVQLAWPLILFNVVVFSVPVVTLMFVGHLGELELSSASIASSFAMVTAFTVMLGLASTLETLCGQAYGAKNYRMLGVYLQSSIIICLGTAFLILALWMNVARILQAMGQDPQIAGLAERYLIFMSPGVFGSGILRPMVKFLQSQSIVMPVLMCSFISMLVHHPCCYIVIHVLGFGFTGGALSNAITYQLLTVLVVLYSYYSGCCKETFRGFTWEAFQYLNVYLKFAIPSTFMLCLEYWTAEILVLASGILPNPQLQLSLLSISLSTTNLASCIPNGLSGAAGTRVANELGAYRPQAAKLAGKVIMGISIVSTCIVASCIFLARDVWGRAFSNVDEVLQALRHLTPLIALAALMDGVQGVLTGVVRGCGRQDMGAYINLVAYYIFGIPSRLYLGFTRHMGAEGLWMGQIIGELVQTQLLALLSLTTNWDKMDPRMFAMHGPVSYSRLSQMSQKAEDAVRRASDKRPLPKYAENQQIDQ